MIASWSDLDAQRLFETGRSRRIPSTIRRTAVKRLLLLDGAGALDDLLSPPGNRLKALRGDREGQHSIRINDQYRICFVWKSGNAHEVGIVDYH